MEAKPFLRAQSIRSDVSPHLPVPICYLSDTETGVAVSGQRENGKTDTETRVLVSMVPFK